MTKLSRKRKAARERRIARWKVRFNLGIHDWIRAAFVMPGDESPYHTKRRRYSAALSLACHVVREEWPRGRGPHSFALYRLVRWWGERIGLIPTREDWERATGRSVPGAGRAL